MILMGIWLMHRQPVLIILSSSCNFRRILDQPFQNVICAFENEPIHDDLIAFSSPPDASLRYQLLDEQNQIQFEKTTPYSTALLLPALSFIYYRLMLFVAQQTRKYYRL